MTLTMTERCDRLDAAIRENRLIRRKWTMGQDRMCLLAALAPECVASESSAACPAEVAPRWLADVTPWIDDSGSDAEWPAMVRRYAAVARRWHVLTPEAWERVRVDWVCDDVLPEGLSHVTRDEWGVRDAVEGVRRAMRDGSDLGAALGRAAWAAEAAWAAGAARAAWAAEAARAAGDAAWAAGAARAAWAAEAARAAGAAAVDRLTSALLGRIERACDAAQQGCGT